MTNNARKIWRFLYWRYFEISRSLVRILGRWTPGWVVYRKKDLSNEISIGITTFLLRYDAYFKSLLISVRQMFPEARIIVAVNGSDNIEAQDHYIEKIKTELGSLENITWLIHRQPSGLTRLWNEIVDAAATEDILLLNDDLIIRPWFRRFMERQPWKNALLCLINASWSHFIINKSCFGMIGPFDESFRGIGFEDIDYEGRLGLAGITLENVACEHILHDNHQPDATSFDGSSGRIWGKYTDANFEHFSSKWELVEDEGGANQTKIYVRQFRKYIRRRRDGGPDFTYHPFGHIFRNLKITTFIEVDLERNSRP